MEIRADLIPNYLKASDPDTLRVLCLKNNLSTNRYHKYDIIFDGKYWYAWYYSESYDTPKTKAVKNAK